MKWISVLPLIMCLGFSLCGCQTTSSATTTTAPPLTNQSGLVKSSKSADLRMKDINNSLQRHYQQVTQEVKQNCPDAETIEQLRKVLQRLREKVKQQQNMLKQQQSS